MKLPPMTRSVADRRLSQPGKPPGVPSGAGVLPGGIRPAISTCDCFNGVCYRDGQRVPHC